MRDQRLVPVCRIVLDSEKVKQFLGLNTLPNNAKLIVRMTLAKLLREAQYLTNYKVFLMQTLMGYTSRRMLLGRISQRHGRSSNDSEFYQSLLIVGCAKYLDNKQCFAKLWLNYSLARHIYSMLTLAMRGLGSIYGLDTIQELLPKTINEVENMFTNLFTFAERLCELIKSLCILSPSCRNNCFIVDISHCVEPIDDVYVCEV